MKFIHLRPPLLICALPVLLIGSGCGPVPKTSSINPTTSLNDRPSLTSTLDIDLKARSIQFHEVATSSGINWTPKNGEEARHYAILESLGSGCAVADFDQDGRTDVFVGGGGTFGPNRQILPMPLALFRNVDEWRFTSVTDGAGLGPIRHYSHGVDTADFDEDGFADVLITGYGGLQLFRNHGDGTFVDDTDASHMDDTSWSSAAGWGDLNHDGILDCVVGHYVNWSFDNHPECHYGNTGQRIVCAPSSFQGLPCMAYLGNGDGTFRDASQELGINQIGKTLGVILADLDEDGQIEVYVANDTAPNQLYKRLPSGMFGEVGLVNGCALGEKGSSDGSMGVDVGDLDGDGRLDIWVANFENESFAFYRNVNNDLFSHSSRAYGVTAVGTMAVGFGTIVMDVNGDGFQDIFCTNGHIHAPDFPVDRRQEPFLFLNEQGMRLRNIAPTAGGYFRAKHVGRGVASADLDGNGTPDLVITHINEPTAVLRNDTPLPNWLSVRLVGRSSPRSAIGARVVVAARNHRQVKPVRGGGSYLSTSDLSLLFGVADSSIIDLLEVHWPSGIVQRMSNVAVRQNMVIVEPNETGK